MASHPPLLGWFKLEIMKGNRAVSEAILSLSVPISFCQVSLPHFKNPVSATGTTELRGIWNNKQKRETRFCSIYRESECESKQP